MGDDRQRKSPDSVAADFRASGGIEELSNRVNRYGKAKSTALDVANYMAHHVEGEEVRVQRIQDCGSYMAFRHYYTVDSLRLYASNFCRNHLLCPLCAIRRGAKALKSYLDRWEAVRAEKPLLKAFMVTLTVKDGDDLAERFTHLHKAQRELWKRKQRGRGSVLDGVSGAVWSYEFKRGKNSGLWHPHLHMIALAEVEPDKYRLSGEWRDITGDSFIVDVRPIDQDDHVSGFLEVFKYAVKFSDQPAPDTVYAWRTLKGKRLLDSAGCFRGVKVPESLTDEPLENLPYVEYFYRFIQEKSSYSAVSRPAVPQVSAPKINIHKNPIKSKIFRSSGTSIRRII